MFGFFNVLQSLDFSFCCVSLSPHHEESRGRDDPLLVSFLLCKPTKQKVLCCTNNQEFTMMQSKQEVSQCRIRCLTTKKCSLLLNKLNECVDAGRDYNSSLLVFSNLDSSNKITKICMSHIRISVLNAICCHSATNV